MVKIYPWLVVQLSGFNSTLLSYKFCETQRIADELATELHAEYPNSEVYVTKIHRMIETKE